VPADRPFPGHLIAFEGPEGVGRAEALELARAALAAGGQRVLVTRPFRQTLSGGIYEQATRFNQLSARTLALVAAADLAERLEWEILPALASGAVVLADRYLERVVQGLARDADPSQIETLCGFAPAPDLVLHFTADAEQLAAVDVRRLDLYDSGMDLGLTRDLPQGYRLYQERLAEEYRRWAAAHCLELVEEADPERVLGHIGQLVGGAPLAVDPRRRAALAAMHAGDDDPGHTLQVLGLAGALFEQTAALHGLGARERALLELAVLLHDVGSAKDGRTHRARTDKLARDKKLAALDDGERALVARLAASHTLRSQYELDSLLLDLPTDARRVGRLLAPLAGLADALDAGSTRTVRWLEVSLSDEACAVALQARDKAKGVLSAAKEQANLFRAVYGREVTFSVRRDGPPPGAALLGAVLRGDPCTRCA
jgi:dTMP kinase